MSLPEAEMWSVCTLLLSVVERWGSRENREETIWRRAADLNLPLTKATLKEHLEQLSPSGP